MSYTDFIKLQEFAAHVLLSSEALQSVNIVTRHTLLNDAEKRLPDKTIAAESLVYITPRNGRKGCGIIVELPQFRVTARNLGAKRGHLTLEFLVLEDRLTNLAPATGTRQAADQVGQMILDAFDAMLLSPFGTLAPEENSIQVAQDFEPLYAYRVLIGLEISRTATARVATPAVSCPATTVTITCATADAEIRYTLDNSFPGPSNSASLVYSAPFEVAVGDVLHVAAFKTGLNQSNVLNFTVT